MPEFAEWLMGFPLGWTEGLFHTQRLRVVGNAVCPQQGALALQLLGGSAEPRRLSSLGNSRGTRMKETEQSAPYS